MALVRYYFLLSPVYSIIQFLLQEKVEGDVDYDNIKFSYPTRPQVQVLKDLNLKIKKGQTVALVGHSGCGKSTCMQLLLRFYDPTEGEVVSL